MTKKTLTHAPKSSNLSESYTSRASLGVNAAQKIKNIEELSAQNIRQNVVNSGITF